MAIKPETVRIDTLKFDPNNVNTHGAESITALVKSLKRFGQQRRILVDADGVVLAGNGLLRAAMRLCWETIDIDRTDLSGAKAKAFAIADNMTAKLSEIDHDVLSEQYESIRLEVEGAANLASAGLNEEDIDRLAKQTRDELDQLIDAMALQASDFKAMRKTKREPEKKDPEPDPDPGPDSDSKPSVNYLVIVKCSGEDSQKQTYESLKNSGYSVEMART